MSLFLNFLSGASEGLSEFGAERKAEEERGIKLAGERQRQELLGNREARDQETFDAEASARKLKSVKKDIELDAFSQDETQQTVKNTIQNTLTKSFRDSKKAITDVAKLARTWFDDNNFPIPGFVEDNINALSLSAATGIPLKMFEFLNGGSASGARGAGKSSSRTTPEDPRETVKKEMQFNKDAVQLGRDINQKILEEGGKIDSAASANLVSGYLSKYKQSLDTRNQMDLDEAKVEGNKVVSFFRKSREVRDFDKRMKGESGAASESKDIVIDVPLDKTGSQEQTPVSTPAPVIEPEPPEPKLEDIPITVKRARQKRTLATLLDGVIKNKLDDSTDIELDKTFGFITDRKRFKKDVMKKAQASLAKEKDGISQTDITKAVRQAIELTRQK